MVANPIVVKSDTAIAEIARLMATHRIGCVPVVDDNQAVIGIVTESDLFVREKPVPFSLVKAPSLMGNWLDPSRLEETYQAFRSLRAADVMTVQVLTVDAEAALSEAASLMMRHEKRRLLVTSAGKLVGVLTRLDILRALYSEPGASSQAPPKDRAFEGSPPPAEGSEQAAAPPAAATAEPQGPGEGPQRTFHEAPVEEVLKQLRTNAELGLDEEEADARLKQFGPNLLTPPRTHGPVVRFLLQFHQPLVYILVIAAVITALLQEWLDSGVIFGVVLVNAIIGFLQESKALRAIEALARSMTTKATVIRAEKKRQLDASRLVPGDVVLLQAGDKVPADLRLISVRGLQTDESALTGESVPVSKSIHPVPAGTGLGDRLNMAFSSTLVTSGAGRGVVVATGDRTEIGRISELLKTTKSLETPLTRKITQFSQLLLYIILALAGVTFFVGILQGEAWLDMFMAAVALAVGAIPEGLPAALTITLAIGVNRMARRNAVIRKLPAVETLGSTTVICSDKTGTLTQNEMTVQSVFAGGGEYRVSGAGYAPDGKIEPVHGPDPQANAALRECFRAGLLCNDSILREEAGVWRVEGDPTEGALISSALKYGLNADEQRCLPRLDAIPFESEHQYMATLHASEESGLPVVYLKGAPEVLLARCAGAMSSDGALAPIDKDGIMRRVDAMAAEGLRVLLFAKMTLPAGRNALEPADVTGQLVFLGLQGMIDPPRPEAISAVRACQQAGIQVKMITGDHAKTAAAVAAMIGLDCDRSRVLTGEQLAALSDDELPAAADSTAVFARVSPEQKLRLVTALQSRGHIVAMTGDGVNDAPALRRADIGVAMGIAGTEVAKEAADMVLTDDNFASIEAAVEEGRNVFDNLVKFITWTIPTNVGEGLVIMAAVFLGATLPILPVQLLYINMTTALLLGLWLAMESKEPGLMARPPRDPAMPILSRTLRYRIVTVAGLLLVGAFGLFQWKLASGGSLAEARTMAVNVFVFGEMFYLFNCRSLKHSMFTLGVFSNPWLIGGVLTMALLQLTYTYVPLMNTVFHSDPIGAIEWLLILGASGVIYLVVEFEKYLRRDSAD
jgi:Ca2+-transporting ATPase